MLIAFTLLAPGAAFAHGHHDGDEADFEALLARYAEIAKFEEQVRVESAVTPYVELNGEMVRVGGPFWNLVRAWVRFDYAVVQKDCAACIPIPEEDFVARAEGVMAQTFLGTRVVEPALDGLEHIVVGAADLGAQNGGKAAAAKAFLEVVETIASKASFLGGAHFLCHPLDVAIVATMRPLNTATNLFRWAPVFGGSRWRALLGGGAMAATLARAQLNVHFVKGPVTIDRAALAELAKESPRRRWGWIPKNKRWAWVERLDREGANSVGMAEARGLRRPRYAFLRLAARDIRGDTPMDRALNQNGPIWIMSVQENLAQRAFRPTDVPAPDALAYAADTYSAQEDDVRRGLSEEFGGEIAGKARLMEGVLRDVEVIFNPSVSKEVRAFHAKTMESLLFGFMYRANFRRALMRSGDVYKDEARGFWGRLGAIRKKASLIWKAGRFAKYILDVSDFMYLASMQKDSEALAEKKYEVMDAIKRIFKTYELSRDVVHATDVATVEALKEKLSRRRDELMTHRPWVEKITDFRRLFSWRPFSRPVLYCHDMNRRVAL